MLLTHIKLEQVARFFDLPQACPSLIVADFAAAGCHLQNEAAAHDTARNPTENAP